MQIGGIKYVARSILGVRDEQLLFVGHQGQHMRTLDQAGGAPEVLSGFQVEDLDRGIDLGRNIQSVAIEVDCEMIKVAARDLRQRYVLDQLEGLLSGNSIDAEK